VRNNHTRRKQEVEKRVATPYFKNCESLAKLGGNPAELREIQNKWVKVGQELFETLQSFKILKYGQNFTKVRRYLCYCLTFY